MHLVGERVGGKGEQPRSSLKLPPLLGRDPRRLALDDPGLWGGGGIDISCRASSSPASLPISGTRLSEGGLCESDPLCAIGRSFAETLSGMGVSEIST